MVVFAAIAGAKGGLGNPAPGWAAPLNLAVTANLYLAPLAAGLAALVAQDIQRLALLTWLSATPSGLRRAVMLRAGAAAVWTIAAWLVGTVVVLSRTTVSGGPDGADLSLAGLALMVLLAALAIGTAVGRLVRHRIAAPVVAIALFAVLYTVSYVQGWAARLSPVYPDVYYRPFEQPHLALVGWQVLLAGSVAAMAVILLIRRLRIAVVVPVAALVLAGIGISAAGGDPVEIRSAPSHPVCASRAGLQVCLRPDNAFALSQTADTFAAAAHNLRGLIAVPSHISEPGMDHHGVTGIGVFIPPDPGAGAEIYADQAVYTLTEPPICHSNDAAQALDDIYLWIRTRIDPSTVPDYAQARIARVIATTDTAQRQWLTRQQHRAYGCRR